MGARTQCQPWSIHGFHDEKKSEGTTSPEILLLSTRSIEDQVLISLMFYTQVQTWLTTIFWYPNLNEVTIETLHMHMYEEI